MSTYIHNLNILSSYSSLLAKHFLKYFQGTSFPFLDLCLTFKREKSRLICNLEATETSKDSILRRISKTLMNFLGLQHHSLLSTLPERVRGLEVVVERQLFLTWELKVSV